MQPFDEEIPMEKKKRLQEAILSEDVAHELAMASEIVKAETEIEVEALGSLHVKSIDWPKYPPKVLEFQKPPQGEPNGWLESDPLPQADIIVITWTTDEWKALHDVLAPDLAPPDSEIRWDKAWYPYTRNFYKIYQNLWNHRGTQWLNTQSLQSPALNQNRCDRYRKGIFGNFCRVSIDDRTVLLFRSCLHLNTDGRTIPLERLVKQMLDETGAGLVLSVGTAGGVDPKHHLGDVVIANRALFRLSDEFTDSDFNHHVYESSWKPPDVSELFASAEKKIMKTVEEETLWAPSPQYEKIIHKPIVPKKSHPKIRISTDPIITTDRFEFGTTKNNLHKIGCAVEMGDAMVAKACHDCGVQFGFIRNVSDPVINSELHRILQGSHAVEIYRRKGYDTSWNSAVAVWVMIAGEIEEGRPKERSTQKQRASVTTTPVFSTEKEMKEVELPIVMWGEGEPIPETERLPGPPKSFREFSRYRGFRNWKKWAPLPEADVLVIVWTQDSFEALHQVFMGAKEPLDEYDKWEKKWEIYNRNSHRIFQELYLQKQLQRDRSDFLSPEGLFAGPQLGSYCLVKIGKKKVVLLYSNLSIRTDGATLPVERMIKQALDEVKPVVVLSTGTAGAVKEDGSELGSVLVANSARFLLGNEFESYSLNGEVFGLNWKASDDFRDSAEKKMLWIEWPELVAPSINYQMPDKPIIPPSQKPRIHIVRKPMITAPRRISMGFFYIRLFELGTTGSNLDLLGCAVETHDAMVAKQCQEAGVDCGFVRAIAVPVMRYKYRDGKTAMRRSWAQLFEKLCGKKCAYNAAVAAWSLIAGFK